MATRNHIGKTLYVSSALPATNDAAGYEALTWTEVAGVIQGPQFGVTHANIEVPDLKTGRSNHVKGASAGVDTQITCRIDGTDAGRTIVIDQANSASGAIAMKLGTGSGTDAALVSGDPVQYAQGYLHSYQENQATTDGYEGFTVGFRQNFETIDDVEPV